MDKKIVVKIHEGLDGKSVRSILFSDLRLSKNIVTKLKKSDEGIMLNGENVRVDRRVFSGDELIITVCEEKSEISEMWNTPIDILYEDEDIILVNKPCTMPTHPSRNNKDRTLANALLYYFKEYNFTFRVITRLDKDTTGVVLIAKNQLSAHRLNMQMKNGGIVKEYVAVTEGVFEAERGEIDAPIGRKDGISRCVLPTGKSAKTHYSVEKTGGGLSYVKLNPVTGRTHQLRVHMSYISHPIFGDCMYGAGEKNGRCRLHCRRLEFMHPVTEKMCVVEAPVPEDIDELVLKMENDKAPGKS